MIKENTVFIIGAGASKPYGYPTGAELKDLINNNGQNIIRNIEIDQRESIRKMLVLNLNDLKKHIEISNPDDQIDWILKRFERGYPYLYDIGRMLIIHIILTIEHTNLNENGNLKCKSNEDWYQELFSIMTVSAYNPNPELFKSNRASFLSFNYDRSLDFFLKRKITNYYDYTSYETNAHQIYSYFKPIHIYGSVSDLYDNKCIAFGNYQNELTHLEKSKANIQLIRVDNNDISNVNFIEILAEAKRIYFLGFGYDTLNLQLLGFPAILRKEHEVFGTAFKKTKGQIEVVKNKILGNKSLNRFEIIDCNCKDLLKEYPPN